MYEECDVMGLSDGRIYAWSEQPREIGDIRRQHFTVNNDPECRLTMHWKVIRGASYNEVWEAFLSASLRPKNPPIPRTHFWYLVHTD